MAINELLPLDSKNTVPKKDDEGNPMLMEYGFSQFKDTQQAILQELPEKTPTGQLPRSIEIIMEDDLIDKIKPGDRVTIFGVYKCYANGGSYNTGNVRC